jgi:acetyl-CoA carboxylase carboxyl transferase subunit alpha
LNPLGLENEIAELERQIATLQELASQHELDVDAELRKLEDKLAHRRRESYQNLTAVQRVQLARHPKRPFTLDYIGRTFTDFIELHGDRAYRDDEAIVGGWARLDGESIMLIGHQKGRDMKENLRRNFGMPHPEGYRKALRLMGQAEKFGRPIVTLIDTPGAYPGIGAEERGQAEAIARNLREMARLRVPIVAVVIGEGGSGGALALGVADRVLMLENAIYSVISPEGCAAILWKTAAAKDLAAEALKLTAQDLQGLGVVDEVVPEPLGGAQHDWDVTAESLRAAVAGQLATLRALDPDTLRARRWQKYETMGAWVERTARPRRAGKHQQER